MPTASSGAASATAPSPGSRERSRALVGQARDSLASGSETRAILVTGLCVIAIGCFFDLPITSDWIVANLDTAQVLQGIGLPLIIVPLLHMFVGEVVPREGVHAASIFNVCRSLSGTIATAWATTSLRLHGESKYSVLLSNTGFYPHGHETILATLAAHADHASADPMRVHLQALQIVAETARRQATVLERD